VKRINAGMLLSAYAQGIFPMAASRASGALNWYQPDPRGIIPLDRFHAPRRLLRTMRTALAEGRISFSVNKAFGTVMRECAAPRPGHPDTWINDEILALYGALHAAGHAHSVEVWHSDQLAGGLYGVSLGAAFFGESMFSRMRDASKMALVFLVERLQAHGYMLLDTQFLTPHLAQFGAMEISNADYQVLLADAISREARFSGGQS